MCYVHSLQCLHCCGLYWTGANVRARNIHATHFSQTFQNTNLMHNSFNLQQYMLHYTPQHVSSSTLLIIRRINCITTASGIITLTNSRTVCGWRADCSLLSTCILYGCLQRVTIPEAVVTQLVLLMMSSSSKHVEGRSVTYILLKNKRIVH